MKRVFVLLLAALLLISMAACGGKEDKKPEQAEQTAPAVQTEAPKQETEAPAPAETEGSTWGVEQGYISLGQNFAVSFPELSGIPQGYGLIAYQPDGSMCLIDVQNAESPEVGSVEEVLPAYFEQLDLMLTFYYSFLASDFEYFIDEQEMTTINGVEMCNYVGHMQFKHSGADKDYKFVAYSTELSNGAYIYFMCVDETADQSLSDSIEDCAYKMALSFHEEN